MKTKFLLLGIVILCCVTCFAQDDALDNAIPTENDERTKPASSFNTIKLFPEMEDAIGKYRVQQLKTNHKIGIYVALINDDTLYEAGYKRKSLTGHWFSYYNHKQLCDSGHLESNIPNGLWKSWYSTGKIRTIRTYSANKLKALKNNSLRYNVRTNLDPIIAMEHQKRGSLKTHTGALQSFKKYVDQNLLNIGPSISVNEKAYINRLNSNFYLPPFTECFHEGLYIDFYPSGEASDSGYYKDGLRDGAWIERLYDGEILGRGAYYHGQKIGIWSFYNKDGKLLALKRFNKKGEEVSVKYYK